MPIGKEQLIVAASVRLLLPWTMVSQSGLSFESTVSGIICKPGHMEILRLLLVQYGAGE